MSQSNLLSAFKIIQGEAKGCHSQAFLNSLYADNVGMNILVKMYGVEHWSSCLKCENIIFDCHRVAATRKTFHAYQRAKLQSLSDGPGLSKIRNQKKGDQSSYMRMKFDYKTHLFVPEEKLKNEPLSIRY